MDGTSLIGDVSVAALKANYFQQQINVSWKNLQSVGMVKIWLATTNNYKTGQADSFRLISEVPNAQQHFLIDVNKVPSSFYKVVIEAKQNSINRWLIIDDKK